MGNKKYLFLIILLVSTIIPVYSDTVENGINFNLINFEDNIQVLLRNESSRPIAINRRFTLGSNVIEFEILDESGKAYKLMVRGEGSLQRDDDYIILKHNHEIGAFIRLSKIQYYYQLKNNNKYKIRALYYSYNDTLPDWVMKGFKVENNNLKVLDFDLIKSRLESNWIYFEIK